MNTKIFIKKAKEIHGETYSYVDTEYINSTSKLKIVCKKHGEFLQKPYPHLYGAGCLKCGNENAALKRTKNNIVEEFKLIHKEKYDYSKVIYISANKNVLITCPVHGDFLQSPKSHLKGYGCSKCNVKSKFKTPNDLKDAAESFFGDRFTFSCSEYKNNRSPIFYTCSSCGQESKTNSDNLFKIKSESGCGKCNPDPSQLTTEKFIKLAKDVHGERYDYSISLYRNAKTKIDIRCIKCNVVFSQRTTAHLYNGSGCPVCKESHGERDVSLSLQKHNCPFVRQHKFKDCLGVGLKPLVFDFYIPSLNLCIEYDGRQHFDTKSKFWSESIPLNDEIKNKYCASNNIKLLRISYLDKSEISEIISSILAMAPSP